MNFYDVMADDELFDRLLCLIIVGGLLIGFIIRSLRNDGDL